MYARGCCGVFEVERINLMFVAYIHDTEKYGTIFASYVSLTQAVRSRVVAGDLVFNNDNTINQSEDWLWDWEKKDPKCYARKAQNNNLNVKGYRWLFPSYPK